MQQLSTILVYTAILLIVMSCVRAEPKKEKNSKGKTYDKTVKVKGNSDYLKQKYIVFDKENPGVFYCPQDKPTGTDQIIVRARPIENLCQFEGQTPEDGTFEPDCYKNVDESDYACKEKYRIMMRLYPPGSEAPYNGVKLQKFMQMDDDLKRKLTPKTDKETS